jgi:hypothetical protein
MEGFNLRLFMDLEKLSDTSEGWNSSAVTIPVVEDDDVFERGGAAADSDDDDDDSEPVPVSAPNKSRYSATATAATADDEFNIDDI